MKTEKNEAPVKRGRGRPKVYDDAENYRFTLQLPEEYKLIIDEYKYPEESKVEFVKRCIIYYCAANDIRKQKSLITKVKESEKININDVAKSIKELIN